MGAAIPYVAGQVAPNHKAYAALAFAALGMVFAGLSLGIWLTNNTSNTLAEEIASVAGLLWGTGTVGIAVYHGDFAAQDDAA